MEIALILKLIIIGIALFSAIFYQIQRHEHKQNLKQAVNKNPATRQLTDEEYQLLSPYLTDKKLVRPYKYQSELINTDVSIIEGACIRHSFSTNGAESSYYFVIDNIEVFFPYGMESYTTSHNIAEVVFTKQFAFVVNLNGFSLATAKEDRDQEALRDEQWQQGSRGQFKTITDDELEKFKQEQHNENIAKLIQQASQRRCEILEQREETPLESLRRNHANTGFLCALALVIATVLVFVYSEDQLWPLIVGGILFIIAIIFYFIKPKREPQKVNRLKGTVEAKVIDMRELLVGDSLSIIYPQYWQQALPEKTSMDVEMDVNVATREMLRYGHSLSISKEIEQYGAPRFWGRNCFLAITGLILGGVLFVNSDSIRDDFIFSYKWLSDDIKQYTINDEQTLKQSAIAIGDWIELDISGASCDEQEYYTCSTVFINSNIVDIADEAALPAKWLTKLAEGTLVTTKRDSQVEMLEMYDNLLKSYQNNNSQYNNYYNNNKKTYTKLLNMHQLALDIDEACAVDNETNQYECNRLKEICFALIGDEQTENHKAFDTWSDLVDFAKTHPQDALLYVSTASEIKSLFFKISSGISEQKQKKLQMLLKKQQRQTDNMILHLQSDYRDDFSVRVNGQSKFEHRQKALYYYGILQGTGKIRAYGLVSDIVKDNAGNNHIININSRYHYQSGSDALPQVVVMTLTFAMITIFTLLQLVLWIVKAIVNNRRINKITKSYNNLFY